VKPHDLATPVQDDEVILEESIPDRLDGAERVAGPVKIFAVLELAAGDKATGFQRNLPW